MNQSVSAEPADQRFERLLAKHPSDRRRRQRFVGQYGSDGFSRRGPFCSQVSVGIDVLVGDVAQCRSDPSVRVDDVDSDVVRCPLIAP